MKKTLSILALAVAGLSLTACSGGPSAEDACKAEVIKQKGEGKAFENVTTVDGNQISQLLGTAAPNTGNAAVVSGTYGGTKFVCGYENGTASVFSF